MKLETPVTGYLADVENRRALGYFRLLSSLLSGRDPYPVREDDAPQEVMVMEMPTKLRHASLRPAAAGFSHR
ncbi:MAG: hypothetical protein ACH37Z_18060 [Anaerolineae bacterium]|nr:hypothetical protein [Anaerolineae bacterium]